LLENVAFLNEQLISLSGQSNYKVATYVAEIFGCPIQKLQKTAMHDLLLKS